MQLKDHLKESFSKEYAYRVKFAHDCTPEMLTVLEDCLQKYNVQSVAPWKRTPIQENPQEFVRVKGVQCVSEVCSTDVVLKYPTNERVLEVWLAVNMGLTPDQVIVYGIKEARRHAADMAAARVANDRDRNPGMEDSVLLNGDNQEHDAYTACIEDEAELGVPLFGEAYNEAFLAELKRIRAEKGADYFRAYPSKDELMGDNLRPMWDDLNNGTNMGRGHETTKTVSMNDQNLGGL